MPCIGGADSAGARRRGGHRRRRRRSRGLAADLDPPVAVLDLDLGQLIVGQQLGELAHQGRIDAHLAISVAALGDWAMATIPY